MTKQSIVAAEHDFNIYAQTKPHSQVFIKCCLHGRVQKKKTISLPHSEKK